VADVIGPGIPGVPKLLTYARNNAKLSREGLDLLGLAQIDPAYVQQIDFVEHIGEMQEVGRGGATESECNALF